MNSKTKRISAAQQTLQAFKDGFYEVDGEQIVLTGLHRNSLNNITLYTPKMDPAIGLTAGEGLTKAHYCLSSLPVVSALAELAPDKDRHIGILNFASAKNPGGGFLNGALAQEESLAMCSNLYLTQLERPEYYEKNRLCQTMLYTDHMIYSKDVVFIRADCGSCWREPMTAAVLTAPAVNMGQYLLKGNTDINQANQVMKDRMRRILQVFAAQKNDTIILGAYGCGVFRNDPEIVARFFIELLKEEAYEQYFREIMFAVYDNSKSQAVYQAFSQKLKRFI